MGVKLKYKSIIIAVLLLAYILYPVQFANNYQISTPEIMICYVLLTYITFSIVKKIGKEKLVLYYIYSMYVLSFIYFVESSFIYLMFFNFITHLYYEFRYYINDFKLMKNN